MALQTKKKKSLSNKQNDVLIVQMTSGSAAKQETVLVEDTDLLVLLIYQTINVRLNVFSRPETIILPMTSIVSLTRIHRPVMY